ncbi:hypothetical protein LWC33_32955 [Pseudonocardia sp. RS11V-5]|uniref:hypothetical protein n=1 Tax=Pseudonocardia terrae TaxID=2905831 RepID=UPI001E507744|nr:hypothetical protein [Pseudonocardia terrae]MCE3556238.1 hypothetical protein [Pseudonocardia terrae]
MADVVDTGDRVEMAVESLIDGARDVLTADVVVYATGYRPTDPLWLLDPALAAACTRDDAGRPEVRRDYRLTTGATPQGRPVEVGLFVQGATEHTHGITSTLLSTVAVRAGEIAAALAGATAPAASRVLTT